MLDPLAGPVSGDPARLQQVVWNLLSNAVKFTPKGGKVQVLLERVNSHVEISVIDTGMGIRPEFLPHVFDRFRQADSSTTRRHGGLGLGLAIVKQLVELHGGTVRAKSPGEGQGSTFIVTLPDHGRAPGPAGAGEGTAEGAGGGRMICCEERALAGVKVLVVDDEPDARQPDPAGARRDARRRSAWPRPPTRRWRLVESSGPTSSSATSACPTRTGTISSAKSAASVAAKELPAAALTAFARSEDRRRALLAGFQTHVAKPVDPAELVAVVASLAGRTGTA